MLDVRPLRSAGFRHLAAAYWVNEFGNWIGEIALTILVYDRTHSALGTAALFLALRFAPALIAPLLTARVEATKARVALPVLYALEAALFTLMAILATRFALPQMLFLAIADGALAISAKALTRSATARELMKLGLLRQGNGILNLGAMISTACSPMIAGGLVAWKGSSSALFVDAATFLAAALVTATARGIEVPGDISTGFRVRLRSGLIVVRRRTAVRRLMVAIAFVMLLSALPLPIEVVFAKRSLHVGDLGYGLMLASWGVGMVIGAAAFTLANHVRLTRVLLVGTLLNAVGYGGLAVSPSLAVACVASVLGGMGNGSAWIGAVTAIQERITLNSQGSVMTLLEGLNQVLPALGFVIGGALTAATSPRLAYAVAGLGVTAVILVASRFPFDHVELDRPGSSSPNVPPTDQQDSGASPRSPSLPTLTIG